MKRDPRERDPGCLQRLDWWLERHRNHGCIGTAERIDFEQVKEAREEIARLTRELSDERELLHKTVCEKNDIIESMTQERDEAQLKYGIACDHLDDLALYQRAADALCEWYRGLNHYRMSRDEIRDIDQPLWDLAAELARALDAKLGKGE